MRRRGKEVLGSIVLAALTACGGGGGGTASAPGVIPGQPPVPVGAPSLTPVVASSIAPSGTAPATIRIRIPAANAGSAAARAAKLVTSNTKAISFSLIKSNGVAVNGIQQGPFGLTATSPGCSADAAGNVTCSLQLDAPLGDDLYVAQTYSTVNAAAGTQNGSGTLALTIARNATNNANLVLNGPISSVVLALGSVPQVGGSTRVFAVALDSSGAVIINPTTYDQPIYLKIALNSVPAGIGLSVAYAIPGSSSAAAPTPAPGASAAVTPAPVPSSGGTASTSQDGGSIPIYSPQDVITLTYTSAAQYSPPGQTTPTITAYVGSLSSAAQVPPLLLTWLPFGAVPTPTPPPATAPPATGIIISPSSVGYSCAYTSCSPSSSSATISESGYSGSYSISGNTCGSLLTLATVSGSTITTLPVITSSGTCALTISDTASHTATYQVVLSQRIYTSASTITCTVGSSCTPPVMLQENAYEGSFTVSGCSGYLSQPINSVINGGTLSVTAVAAGSCLLTVSDGTRTATLSVTVNPSSIVVSPASFTCYVGVANCTGGNTGTVLEANFAGTFTFTPSACSGVSINGAAAPATPAPIANDGNFTVGFTAAGSCTYSVSDGTQNGVLSLNIHQPQVLVRTLGSSNAFVLSGSWPSYSVEHANASTTINLQLYVPTLNYTTGALTLLNDTCTQGGYAGSGLQNTFSISPSVAYGGFLNINAFTMNPPGPSANYCSFSVKDPNSGATTTVQFTADEVGLYVQRHRSAQK